MKLSIQPSNFFILGGGLEAQAKPHKKTSAKHMSLIIIIIIISNTPPGGAVYLQTIDI